MVKDLDIADVLDDINAIISHGSGVVKRVGVFGSLARGDFSENSDIDVLIEYASTPVFNFDRFLQFCELCNRLIENLTNFYGRKVDLVQFENSPSFTLQNDRVEKEVVWL